MLLLSQSDTATSELLTAKLAEVEACFATELISELPCVNALVGHIERYRGKMLRPTLVLVAGTASGRGGGSLTDRHKVVATVAEMVHMATLVHDDVLDEASVRRRNTTINYLAGNEAAVMLGDYLISHAYHLCSSLGSPVVSRTVSEATNTVCEGELLQLANRGNVDLDEQTYFQIIRRKTASLCGTCCRLGAVLNGVSEDVSEDLHAYGEKLGLAYQIVDDLLDLTGAEETVGKTLGRDLDKGKITLPLIHYLKTMEGAGREELAGLLRAPERELDEDASAQRAQRVRELIGDSGSVAYAMSRANKLIDQAKGALDQLKPGPARALLVSMADAVLTRKY